MKSFKKLFIILVIFLKTGNVLSEINLFNVNNIEITNNLARKNEVLANQAIKKGFEQLITRLLLKNDINKVKKLKFSEIKDLVSYYQIQNKEKNINERIKVFNIFFDKEKIHELFYRKEISYSNIFKNELYLLPILKKDEKFFIYSQNYFYDNWNKIGSNEIVEFFLPIENIETIQKINLNKENILDLNLDDIFQEYKTKNLALIIIEENNKKEKKIFMKTKILERKISKNLTFENNSSLNQNEFDEEVIEEIKKEIINLVKLQNLIDVRTPSFINIKYNLDNKNNLPNLNEKIKKIDLIENIYVQELNNKYALLKIKYLGKIDKIINQLEKEKIILKLSDDVWSLKIY